MRSSDDNTQQERLKQPSSPKQPSIADRAFQTWLRQAVKAEYGDVADEPLPPDLEALLNKAAGRTRQAFARAEPRSAE